MYNPHMIEYDLQPKVITLKNIYSNLNKVFVSPVKDRNTNQMRGVKPYTEDQARMVSYVATNESKRELKHGTQFNLANFKDRVDWEWVKELPIIASSEDEARSYEGSYQFYIYDGDRENNRKIKKSELVHKANIYIHNTPLDSFPDKARLLNERIEHLAPSKIKELLLDKVETKETATIMKVISIYEDTTADERLLLYKLKDRNTITYRKGVYYFGEIMLGQTEEQVIAYMKMHENKHIYNTLVLKAYPELANTSLLKTVMTASSFNTYKEAEGIVEEKPSQSKEDVEAQIKAEVEKRVAAEIKKQMEVRQAQQKEEPVKTEASKKTPAKKK